MKKIFAILALVAIFSFACYGQVTVKGNVVIKGNAGLNNISLGPPNYEGAIVSNLIVPAPGTYTGSVVPNLSTSCTVNSILTSCNKFSGGYPAVVTDSSYFDWLGIHNQSTYTRCTDARSIQDKPNANIGQGIGGSSLYQLINANSTLMAMDAAETVITTIRIDPSGNRYCAAPTFGGGPADYITCGAACVPGTATQSASIVITKAMNTVDGGVNTSSFNFGSPDFDLNDPSDLWAWGPSNFQNSTNTTVTGPVVFGGSNQHNAHFVPDGSFNYPTTPIVDFYFALPMGSAVSEHATSTGYTLGQYVKHTMYLPGTATPEIYQYALNTAYPQGALIQPGANGDPVSITGTNPNNCVYKAGVDGGTTGSSAADFGSHNPCIGDRVNDGTQHWYGIWVAGTGTSGQNGPSFILQAVQTGSQTTAGGTFAPYTNTGVTACAYGLPTPSLQCKNPDIATQITDGGEVWQNSGPNLGSLALLNGAGVNLWNVTAGVSGDDTKFGISISTNTYGPNASGNYITSATTTSNNTAGQGSAQWALEADLSDPVTHKPTFYTLNTASGLQTNETCSGTTLSSGAYGGLPNTPCNNSGVTWSTPTSTAFPNGSPFFALTNPSGGSTSGQPTGYGSTLQCYGGIHNEKVWYTGLAVTFNISPWYSDAISTNCSSTYHYFEWLPRGPLDNGAFDPYINVQLFQAGVPHYALGKSNIWSDGGSGGGYGQTSGVMTVAYSNINVSGNNGALPVRCGTGPVSPITCKICTPNSGSCGVQPAFTQEPYTFSITGSDCSSSTISNSGYPTNGMQPNVYGIFSLTPGASQSGAPPCNILGIWDWHFDAAYDPGQNDAGWLIGVVNNATQFLPLANSAWQSEVTAYQQLAQCGAPLVACLPLTTVGKQKRFGHTFAYATSNIFETSVQVSSSAIDGTFTAFGTEWFDQFGSYSNGGNIGAPTGLPATYVPYLGMPATLLCLCGPPWQPSYPYLVGELMDPLPPNAAQDGKGGIDVFQVTAVSSAHSPYGCDVAPVSTALNGSGDMPTALWNAFNGAVPGGTVTDNCVTWTDVGSKPNPRGDVVLLTTR